MALPRDLVNHIFAYLQLDYVEQHSIFLTKRWLIDTLALQQVDFNFFANMAELTICELAHYIFTALGRTTRLSKIFFSPEFHLARSLATGTHLENGQLNEKFLQQFSCSSCYTEYEPVILVALAKPDKLLADWLISENGIILSRVMRIYQAGYFPDPEIRELLRAVIEKTRQRRNSIHEPSSDLNLYIRILSEENVTDDEQTETDDYYEQAAAELNVRTLSEVTEESRALRSLSYRALKRAMSHEFPQIIINRNVPAKLLESRAAPMAALVRQLYRPSPNREHYLARLEFIQHSSTADVTKLPQFFRAHFNRFEAPFPFALENDTQLAKNSMLYQLFLCPNLPELIRICQGLVFGQTQRIRSFLDLLFHFGTARGLYYNLLPLFPTWRKLREMVPIPIMLTELDEVPLFQVSDYYELLRAQKNGIKQVLCLNHHTLQYLKLQPIVVTTKDCYDYLEFQFGELRIHHLVHHLHIAEAWTAYGINLNLE